MSILSGSWPVRLNLEFLYWHNATDLQILRNIKGAFNARSSMCHSALVMANAFMHAGTTVDTFLRDNLEWLKTATNWAMFGATASLGVIHRGHLGQVRLQLHLLVLRKSVISCHLTSHHKTMIIYLSRPPTCYAVWPVMDLVATCSTIGD